MPAATIGLFALAIVLIAIAFLINQAVDDDGGGGAISEADAFKTVQANQTAQAAANETPGGNETQQGGNETPQTTQSPSTTETPDATQTTGAGEGEYTVQSGDTCSGIAADNDVTLADLLEANDMTEEDCLNLQEGDTLVIP
jgi:LysM repeat protein